MTKLLLLLFSGLKFAKLSKLLFSGGSMILSVFAYSLVFGWRYAAGFVGLLMIHEAGHYLAARQRGLDVGLPTFIPFVGAWVELKQQPMDVETEAYVGIAGPVAGTAGALACFFLAKNYGSTLLLALAYAGFMLNLFNLIPLSPLDGGRITAILSPRIWLLGMPILIALFVYRPSPMLILIGVLAAPQVWAVWRNRHEGNGADYYRAPLSTRVEYGLYYLVLVAFLALLSFDLHEQLAAFK
ncbi:site-2 protease family protein [Noviherbaspirillum massiliense]|uniref:site-2 protease family protein n=1 Tax=Noviherbaspirillum massiliense TaxID=1465823 RepID=UPI0002FBF918|nr:site-2 protease family protein [Noviherbaspirillum massiliense]